MRIRIESVKAYRYSGRLNKQCEAIEEEYGEILKPYGFKVIKDNCYINITTLKQLFDIVRTCDDLILKYDETNTPYVVIYDDVLY